MNLIKVRVEEHNLNISNLDVYLFASSKYSVSPTKLTKRKKIK